MGVMKIGKSLLNSLFAEPETSGYPEGGLKLSPVSRGSLLIDECHIDSHLAEGDVEEIVCAAIDAGGTYHMVAGLADIEAGEEIGRLPRGCQNCTDTAFHLRDPGRYIVAGGILETRIEVARILEVEEPGHLLAVLILEGGTLDNWNLAGFAPLGSVSALNAESINFLCHSLSLKIRHKLVNIENMTTH